MPAQAGQLGERSIPLSFPEGWLLDDGGGSITRADVAPTDVAAVALGVAVASADLALHHSSFTLNNLLACLIATDILQVSCPNPETLNPKPGSWWCCWPGPRQHVKRETLPPGSYSTTRCKNVVSESSVAGLSWLGNVNLQGSKQLLELSAPGGAPALSRPWWHGCGRLYTTLVPSAEAGQLTVGSLCPRLLQLLGLRSFRAAAVLLVGLLAYDVFWVFGSPRVIGDNVMLAVATSDVLTGPTRLLFPRFSGSVGEASSFPFSLLGGFAGLPACCGRSTASPWSSECCDRLTLNSKP